MLSSRYATPLFIPIRPSRSLAGFYLLVHLLTIFVLLSLPLDSRLLLVLIVVVAIGGYRLILRQALLLFRDSVVRVEWREQGWNLCLRDGRELQAELSDHGLLLPWLVILPLKPVQARGIFRVMFFDGRVDADLFRRLRVRLRLQAGNF